MIRNSLFIILFLLLFFPLSSWAATLYLMPQSQSVWQGDSFICSVWIDTEKETINTVEGYLNFPQDKLEIVDISKGGSILELWPKAPSYSNQTGKLDFAGGIPKGFYGQAQLLSITFRVFSDLDSPLSTSIIFGEDSQVLLHDGKGTPASLSFLKGNYEIFQKPENLPKISSNSHPDQDRWYPKNSFYLRWDLIEGVKYSYLLSHDPLAEPDEIPDAPEGDLIWMGDIVYAGLEDGIYYFHLRQGTKTEDQELQWTPKITYRAMIDATPPEPLELEIAEIEEKNYLIFATTDKTSGVDFYEIKEGERGKKKISSPYLLEDQSLRSEILVRAVDKAGNERTAEYIPPPRRLTWRNLIIAISVLIGVIVIWQLVKFILRLRKFLISK